MAHPRIELSRMANIPAKAVTALNSAGYRRLSDLKGVDLESINGVGEATAAKLESELAHMEDPRNW